MAIGTKPLIDCVNAAITAETATLPLLQLSSVSRDFDVGFVKSVACAASLPAAADNKGRMIYIENLCSYRISDGTAWTNDFTSTLYQNLTAYSWGENSFGRLGVGDDFVIYRSSPVSIVGGFTDWKQVEASSGFSRGVRSDGTIWSWGYNGQGQLGTNNTISRNSPVSVVGGFSDWCQISTGHMSWTHGIRTNGTLWAWGSNNCGQLGDNTIINRSSPVSLVGGFTDWCRLSGSSFFHSAGTRSDGTLWTWGNNDRGQLGDNTTITRSSPVSVVGGFTDWCQAASGYRHTIGLRSNGTLWAWGYDRFGVLGINNSSICRSSPVSVVGGFTDWCHIRVAYSAVAIRTNGTAWSWGRNQCGQLGDNTVIDRSSPVSLVGGFTDWCQVSATVTSMVGVRTNGTAWGWGRNHVSQLGDNTDIDRSSPVSVVGGFTDWCQVSAGSQSHGIRGLSRGF